MKNFENVAGLQTMTASELSATNGGFSFGKLLSPKTWVTIGKTVRDAKTLFDDVRSLWKTFR